MTTSLAVPLPLFIVISMELPSIFWKPKLVVPTVGGAPKIVVAAKRHHRSIKLRICKCLIL
jgi:hypothetical protein